MDPVFGYSTNKPSLEMGITKKLKKLMKKYPTLPVAVLLSNCKYEDALDCEVGYVYDSSSGEFKEKVIAVFSGEETE